MWRKRRFRRKTEKVEGPDLIETVAKEFDVLEEKYKNQSQKIDEILEETRKRIRRYDSAPYYRKRNKLLQFYVELSHKKNEIARKHWQKQFLNHVSPLLDKYEDLCAANHISPSDTKPPVPIMVKKEPISSSSYESSSPPSSSCYSNSALEELKHKSSSLLSSYSFDQTENSNELEDDNEDDEDDHDLIQDHKHWSLEQIHEAFLSHYKRQDNTNNPQAQAPKQDECSNPECKNQPLLLIQKESKLLCVSCGQFTKQNISLSNNLHFGDDNDTVSQNAYERKKNFKAYLSQFSIHAKEIPEQLIRDAQRAFRDILVRSKLELRCTPCKEWLKKHEEYRKYVDCAARIVNILNKRPVPRFTPEQIDKFVKRFEATQLPFLFFKGILRVNFLNSCYLMNKFVILEGLGHLQACFPLLRHRKTLLLQDELYQKICAVLKWKYEKSI